MLTRVLLAAMVLLWLPAAAMIPRVVSVRADQHEVTIRSSGARCPTVARRYDLWADGRYQDTCSSSREGRGHVAVCYFRYRHPPGLAGLLVRAGALDNGCAPNGEVQDIALVTRVTRSAFAPVGRLLLAETPTYAVELDRDTGAVYYLRNKNATTAEGRELNVLHPHVGAAMQVAVHHGAPGSLTEAPCAGQGYLNPTQAGALCGYPAQGVPLGPPPAESGAALSCDGGPCGTAFSREARWEHVYLYNFDYGPSYPGPRGDADTFALTQKVTAHRTFLELEYALRSDVARGVSATQLPTYYWSHLFQAAAYEVAGERHELALPDPASAVDAPSLPPASHFPADLDWASFAMEHPVYGRQTFTVQTYPGESLRERTVAAVGQTPNVSLTARYKRVNYSFTLANRYPAGEWLRAWTLVVPNAPDERIDTPFGRMAVRDFLLLAKAHYALTQQSLPPTPG